MKSTRSAIVKTLCLLTWLCTCLATSAHADAYGDVGELMRANKMPEAMAQVDNYLVSKPADPQMRFLKGMIQRQLGQQAEALTTFTQLTEDYPELPEPYNNLAVILAGQGQYDKARAALESALRANPDYAIAYENLGDVYARLASQAYAKALQLDSNNPDIPRKLTQLRDVFPAKPAPVPAPAASEPKRTP